MAGPAPTQPSFAHASPTPYGHQPQTPPMPAYDPRMGKRPGGTATKVWGIVLIILGAFGVINLISAIVMLFGGFNTAAFTPTLSPDAKAAMEQMQKDLIDSALSRPSFYIHLASEFLVVGLSLLAGIYLVIKPKPLGAKLALARVAVVLLALPIYAYETNSTMEGTMASQEAMMRAQMEHERKKSGNKGPNTDEIMGTMNTVMKGVGYGTMVVTVVFVLIINGLLAFQMSRPHIKEYLAGAATEKVVIPGYDPSMGLMMPPPGAPPGPQAPVPPPPQQAPPPGR